MKFTGFQKERKGAVRVLFALAAAYMMYLEIMQGEWIFAISAFLVILACFFKKEYIISEKGVDIEYHLFNWNTHNLWKWDSVTTIHTDYRKAAPRVMLHIGKDIVTRTYIYEPYEIEDILKLARLKNDKIFIEKM